MSATMHEKKSEAAAADEDEEPSFAELMQQQHHRHEQAAHPQPGVVARRPGRQPVGTLLAAANSNQHQHGICGYKTPGCQNKKFQRLKQGKLKVTDRCDLHGCTARQAERQLALFLNRRKLRHNECVLLICGKGLHSAAGEPVIKNLAMDFMRSHPDVLAYCPALQCHGGHGAFYVLMRHARGLAQ